MKLIRNELILILAILFVGLFFRIYGLGNESIWLDEGFSIRLSNLNLFHIVEETSRDVHPPLYYIILHYWINLFGDSEFSTRFLSVIFGFFAIFMIYKIGSLIFCKNVGVLSSLLLGLSIFHIQYSQEVRSYSLMSLLTLLSFYFFIRHLDKRSLTVLTGYVISSLLLLYTHFFGFFIIIAQNIYFLTLFLLSKNDYKLNLRRWILLQIILIVLYTPWISILINQIFRIQGGFWIPTPTIRSIIDTFFSYSGSVLLLLFFLILSSFSIVSYKKIEGKINWGKIFKSIESYSWNISLSGVNKFYLLLMWLLTPIILPFIISQFSTPIYLTRCTIGASLPFYLLIAKGIENIRNKSIMLVIISLVVTFSLVNVWEYYTETNNEQWREVANYVDINAKPEDLLLFNAGFCQEYVFDYYSKRPDLNKKPFNEKTRDINEENIKELEPIVEGYNRIWVILRYSIDYKGLIVKTLNESYNLSYHKKYVGIEVYLFEKDE